MKWKTGDNWIPQIVFDVAEAYGSPRRDDSITFVLYLRRRGGETACSELTSTRFCDYSYILLYLFAYSGVTGCGADMLRRPRVVIRSAAKLVQNTLCTDDRIRGRHLIHARRQDGVKRYNGYSMRILSCRCSCSCTAI